MQVVGGLQAFIQPLCLVPVTYVRPRVTTGNRKHGKTHHNGCSSRAGSTDSQLHKSYEEATKSVENLVKSGTIDKYIIDSVIELSKEGGKRHLANSKKISFKNSSVLVNAILDFDGSPAAQLTQRRGFKTKARRSELDSESSLIDRIPKRFINLRKYLGKVERKDPTSVTSEWVDHKNLTPEEKSNVRIAFLEGYVTGRLKIPVGTLSTRVGKRPLYYKLLFTVGLIGLYYVLTSSSGKLVRVNFSTKKNLVSPEDINVTFQDVCGVDEAKQELQEIVEFLRDPQKFSKLGGKLPRGVLLVGPPGTGKTLLARAVAGEAGVPFFHAAGPEFDEILVGQGARRVRDLFSTAKIRAPCVVFIDEIDSIGGKRTNSVLHPYANQTINQLLTEMDGFHQNEGVIVLGATNRRDDLDRALLRPGRFDVEVQVPVPDLKGREEILSLYLKKVKLAPDVEPKLIAKRTVGFTGADLENLVNQAALRAAIENRSSVSMKYFELARDRALMGPERKNKIMDEDENRNTAYHEAGHALVSLYTKDADPLHKVTILQRGGALGHTAFVPEKDIHTRNKSQLLAMMDCSMGGRVSEELIFGADKVTNGASQDFKSATSIATIMVKHYGMSEKIGVRFFEENDGQFGTSNNVADATNELIDSEIKRLLQESYDRAKAILKHKAEEHRLLAEALLKYETLDAEDVKLVIQGKNPVNVHA